MEVTIPPDLTREEMRNFILEHARGDTMNKAQEMFEISESVERRERRVATEEADKMYQESLSKIEQDARKGEFRSHFYLTKRCDLLLEDALKNRFWEEGFFCAVSGDGLRITVSWYDFT